MKNRLKSVIVLASVGAVLFTIGNWMAPMDKWTLVSTVGSMLIGIGIAGLIYFGSQKG